jgi:uncharacterized protein YecE (DUF72 family)
LILSSYVAPNLFVTKRWAKVTPDNFRFTAKIPRSITHEKRLGADSEKDLVYLFQMLQPLKSKLLALLIQLPPSLTAKEGLKKLEALIHLFDPGFRYAIEVRNKSWFVVTSSISSISSSSAFDWICYVVWVVVSGSITCSSDCCNSGLFSFFTIFSRTLVQ